MAGQALAIDDIVEVKLYTVFDEQIAINVLHYLVSITAGVPTVEQAAASVIPFLGSNLLPLISIQSVFKGGSVQRIKALPPSLPAWSVLGAGDGTATGDSLPRQTAGIITKRTAIPGRANRGRVYVPFPVEDQSGSGPLPTTTYVSLLDTWAADLLTIVAFGSGANQGNLYPSLYHRGSVSSTVLTSMLSRRKWATQRRRGSYGRPNTLPPELS